MKLLLTNVPRSETWLIGPERAEQLLDPFVESSPMKTAEEAEKSSSEPPVKATELDSQPKNEEIPPFLLTQKKLLEETHGRPYGLDFKKQAKQINDIA